MVCISERPFLPLETSSMHGARRGAACSRRASSSSYASHPSSLRPTPTQRLERAKRHPTFSGDSLSV